MGKFAALIVCLIAAGCAPAFAAPVLGADQILPTSEIRPGMVAVGKTVFHGTDIEEFHLEILGVAEKARGGTDVILARVTDGPLVERHSSILQGMSGSPVYINGRLIGAIAFSWAFAKEPIAGITPIQDMLKVLEAGAATQERPTAASLERPVVIDGRRVDAVRIADPMAPVAPGEAESPGTLTLRPMGCVFLVSGCSPRGLDRLRQALEPLGAGVVQGTGGSADFAAPKLEPGSAMAVQLVSGDFQAAAIGTVTAVIGDKVLAFGHPMMSMGDVDLPMATAYIQTIVPSYSVSMKMGVAGKPIGRLSQDRLWAVAGVTGEQARPIPISITVSDPALGIKTSYNAQIARHRLLSPGLAATVVLSAIDRAWSHVGEGTAEVAVEIEGPQGAIRRTDVGFDQGDAAASATGELVGPLATLMNNEFGSVDVKSIRLDVRVTTERRTARLERLRVEPGKHKAGESLKLAALLRPYKGQPVEKTLELKLPADLPSGQLRIGVAGGNDVQPLRASLGLTPPRAFDINQLIDIYQTAERGDEVVAFAALPTMGMSVEGRRLTSLPGYLLESLNDARSSVITPERDAVKTSITCDWVVEGRQVIAVDIEGKPGVARARAPKPGPAPPPGGARKGEEAAQPPDEGDGEIMVMMMPAAANTGAADAEAAEAEKPGAKKEQEKEKEKEEPVGREPSSFTYARRADFLSGKFDGIACDQDGTLTLAPQATVMATFDEPVISAILVDAGAVYAATAPDGRVRKMSGDGQVEQTWETGAVLITCLAGGPEGAILAGAAPGGRILSLAKDGKVQDFSATGEDTVWSIAPAPGGGFYAGTGPAGKVFLIPASGDGRLLCQLPATNVYALAVAEDTLYAGTGNAGVLYAIDPTGQARAVYESDEQAISALAVSGGAVYAGTAPDAEVIRIGPGRVSEQIMQAEGENLVALAAGASGMVYAVTAGDGVVYEVDPVKKTAQVLRKPEAAQALALALDARGAVYAAESNPAALVRLGPEQAERGVFLSKPQEAASGTRWGAASAGVRKPDGTTATFQTRSGDGEDPDDHWSLWSAPADLSSVSPVVSPAGTFLQYRITLTAQQPGATPAVRDVQVVYMPPNQEPVVSISAPKPAERLHAKFTLKWKAQDPDGDTLVYALATSADGGATWKDLKSDVDDTSYSWDTTGLKDGTYMVRVTASDRPSNPGSARQNEARQLVWIDNTPPTVLAWRSTLAVNAEKRATFRGAISDALSPIRGVDYRVDDGKWRAAAVEGMVGTEDVSFSVETEPLAAGEHVVEVRGFDQAGNTANDELRVAVEGAATEATPAATEAESEQQAPAKPEAGEPEGAPSEETRPDGADDSAAGE
jgi:hypothetical protein